MGKKNPAKKKNHVSKHILKSREDDTTTTFDKGNKDTSSSKKKDSRRNSRVKHPEEAASYLLLWKASKSEESSMRGPSSWKFNKNTQSWLIRHMYEVDKVPKSTFLLLLEYFDGLEGKFIIDRIRAEASRRCRRHKEYCKTNILTLTTESDRTSIDQTISTEKDGDDKKKIAVSDATHSNNAESKMELDYEEGLWRKLDDHGKRKQYKRARKILDLMNQKE